MIKWEDTVINKKDLFNKGMASATFEELTEAQAEITFPLAEEQGRKAGREEVVGWVEGNLVGGTEHFIGIDGRKWQAKLKEWGI